MPRINPVDLEQIDTQTADNLTAVRRKLGKLPNLHVTLAQAPTLLQAYVGYTDALSRGRLTARQREMVALAMAQANGCRYCLSAHSLLGKGAGLSSDELHAARRGQALDAQEQAVLSLALGLLEQRGRLRDEQLDRARAAGLDDGLVLEVLGHVALNTLTNFGNNLAQTEIDFPEVALQL